VSDSTATTFAELLRRFRREAGWSQEQLAERADISRRTVSDLERGIKTTPQTATLELLTRALDLSDAERSMLLSSVPKRRRGAEPARTQITIRGLPADVTPLVGRESHEAAAIHLLRSPNVRLLNLVGPGGVGKTRLATRVTRTMANEFEDGGAFVPLAAISEVDDAAGAIARGLGITITSQSAMEAVSERIGDREMLLVLDNLEQLEPIALQLSELLTWCSRLRILTTSRSPLNLRGEQLLDVPPLEFPRDHHLSTEAALGYPAVALFVQRSQAVRPEFRLTDAHVGAVVEICRRLDGLPLAIELAAVRMRHLSPAALLRRLEGGMDTGFSGPVDAPERQRTMAAAIGWSYALLEPEEQGLFRSLSVFRAGANIAAIEAVSGMQTTSVLRLLDSLTSKSLVLDRQTHSGDPRFTMLETVSEYGREKAETAGELEDLRQQHATHFRGVVRAAYEEQLGHGISEPAPRLEPDHPNIVDALRWLTDRRRLSEALEMAAELLEFWVSWAYVREGRQWLERLITLAEEDGSVVVPPIAHLSAARMASIQNDQERAVALYQLSLEGYEREGDARTASVVLNNLGTVAHQHTDYETAATYYERAAEQGRLADNAYAVAMPVGNLGTIAMQRGDFEEASRLFDEAIALYRRAGNKQSLAIILGNRGSLARRQGRYDEAAAIHEEALEMQRAMGDRLNTATSLGDLAWTEVERSNLDRAQSLLIEALESFAQAGQRSALTEVLELAARIAQERGRLDQSARFYSGADALRKDVGVNRHPADQAHHDRALSLLRAAMEPSAYTSAWTVGQTVPLDTLLEEIRQASPA